MLLLITHQARNNASFPRDPHCPTTPAAKPTRDRLYTCGDGVSRNNLGKWGELAKIAELYCEVSSYSIRMRCGLPMFFKDLWVFVLTLLLWVWYDSKHSSAC